MFVVIGSGAWATTIANILAVNQHSVSMLVHRQEYVEAINTQHAHPKRAELTGLAPSLTATTSSAILDQASGVIIGLPSAYMDTLDQYPLSALSDRPFLLLTKGLSRHTKSSIFISDYLQETYNLNQLAILSGPNLATEIHQQHPAASVIASHHEATHNFFQKALNSKYFRLYTSTDMRGVELGGIIKNVYAIAAGCIHGLHLGSNATASYLCRAMVEIQRIGQAFNTQADTLFGLSGMGDLIATSISSLSRNHTLGVQLSTTPDQVSIEGYAEGPHTARVMAQFARRHQLDTPILFLIDQLLNKKIDVSTAINQLMSRSLKTEFDDVSAH